MSTVSQLKDALEHSVTDFLQKKASLSKCVTKKGSARTVQLKVASLADSLKDLNVCHTSWVSKGKIDATTLAAEAYSREWLAKTWDEVDDLMDQANEIIAKEEEGSAVPTLSNANRLSLLRKQMETLQSNITNELNSLTTNTCVHTKTINSSTHTIYTEMLSNVSKQLTVFGELSNSILTLSGVDFEKDLVSHEEFRQKEQKRVLDVQVKLAKLVPESSQKVIGPTRTVEMEKCKAPSFDGKTINYPGFKRSWCKVAGTVWDDANQIEQLKQKVDEYTKKIVSRCFDMKAVWEALDQEYGQEQEVVNAVNSELKILKSALGSTPEYIINLRNSLPGLEETLKSVNGLEHLQTPDKVNLLVEKFDERYQHEWEYFRSKSTGSTYERFFKFLLDRYDSCKSIIARQRSCESAQEVTASGSVHHVSSGCFRCKKWVAKNGDITCAACGNVTAQGNVIEHCLEHCSSYVAMSVNQRSDCVQNAKWCPVHLLSTHELQNCTQKNDPRMLCNIGGCDKHHHRSLHGSTTKFVAEINSISAADARDNNVLLCMQTLATTSGTVNSFFDDGSTCCLILFSAAERLGLIGEEVTLTLETVTGDEYLNTKLFSMDLLDDRGQKHTIKVFGVNKICGAVGDVDLSGIQGLFSQSIQNSWAKVEERPVGEVEVLIGANQIGLHPLDCETIGNMKVKSSSFGSGLVAVGCHKSIKSTTLVFDETVSTIRSMKASSHHVRGRLTFKSVREYLESSDLAVPTPRRCNNCMNCNECSFRGHQMSLQEQYEYQIMEKNVCYEEASKRFTVNYVFTEDPSILKNNLSQVIKIAEREEKKLEKEGLIEAFNAEFEKVVELGSLAELSREEMDAWTGPVHYVSLQHVLNEKSATTPLRIVTNSSLSDRNGISLNSIMMKGPNVLTNQFEVLARWRCYEEALASDFTKAYYSMKTGELETHIRRVVWRFGKRDAKWRFFGYKTVTFGDKPAGVYLHIVIMKTVEMFGAIDPSAAKKIENDRYVDDLATGGSSQEVKKMKGDENEETETEGTLTQILSQGALKLKVVVTSGEKDTEKAKKLGNSVLGLGWDPLADKIQIDLQGIVNETPPEPATLALTKRKILGIVNKPHDLLGLISPITIRLKVAYRDLFKIEPPLDWDDIVPSEKQAEWADLLAILHSADNVKFDRATKPKNAVGNPEIVGFFDGSDDAYAAVLYYRWILVDGSVHVALACSNARVTPLKRISTPRAEMNGAVMLTRLTKTLVKACSLSGTIPSKVWFIGDSECTLGSIEKTSGAFGEYFGNRVSEIHSNQAQIEEYCPVGSDGEWWHVASEDNAADQPTKTDSTLEDVSYGSTWQNGPRYLQLPQSEWPINREFADRKDSKIPSSEILKKFRAVVHHVNEVPEIGVQNLIDPLSTNYWDVLIRRTEVLLTPFFHKRGIRDTAARFKRAENLWYQVAMKETREALAAGRLKKLCSEERDNLVVVVGRASVGLHKICGKEYLPVVMAKSRVGVLLMLSAHYEDHDDRDITMSLARKNAWIIGAKKLASSICDNCVRCRWLHKRRVEQKMSALPAELQLPSPPFSNIGLDLCGPIVVHAMTNKRATMKVWNVIFVCLNTKAVTMYLAPGYATEDFMLAYNSHISDHGLPNKVHSDKGSQLVAAGKEIADFEWDVIAKRASTQGTTWKFAPAGGQWRNGAVEIFVKKFKKSFEVLYKKTRMNYAEMACAVKRVANILNDRPLSVQKSQAAYPDKDFLLPLTPNMLITGRSGSLPPIERENGEELPAERLSFIEELERCWWYQYKVQYFDSLIPTQKWLHKKRNMCIGDVVLIEYKTKSFPGTYRLGRVDNVVVDADGLVRTCTVTYKLIKSTSTSLRNIHKDITTKQIAVPVQRLIIILPIEEQ